MVKLLKLWFKHVFSLGIIAIVTGSFQRLLNLNSLLYHKRYKKCKHCIQNEYHAFLGEICGICGCPLKSKLRVKGEICELNKW